MTDTLWLYLFWTVVGLLVYIQFGYALVVMILGRRPPKAQLSEQVPLVSIIIPAHNEEKVLYEKLENALGLGYPSECLEIIVASDGSLDRTNEIARSFTERGVKLLDFKNRRGKASVLNDAVSAAKGTVVCLCDANVMFREDALQRLVAPLSDPTIGAVTGDVRLASEESNFGEGESLYYKIEKRMQEAESQVGSLMGVDGGMYVIRKELYRSLPADTILDDFVASICVMQQGYRVVYEPSAIADENGTPHAIQEYRRRVRVSAGAVQTLKRRQWPPWSRPVVCWQYFSHKLLRWFNPLWLVLLFVSNLALWNVHWFYQVTLVVQIALYLLAAVALVSLRFRQTRIGGVPFYYVLSHVAMTVGIAKGICNRQQVTWQQADRISTTGNQGSRVTG